MTQEQREMLENMEKLLERNKITQSEFDDVSTSIDNFPGKQAVNQVSQSPNISVIRIKKAGGILKLILTKTIIIIVIPAFVAGYQAFQISSNQNLSLSEYDVKGIMEKISMIYIFYYVLLFFISISILIDFRNIANHLINCDKPITLTKYQSALIANVEGGR